MSVTQAASGKAPSPRAPSAFARFLDSDFVYSFRHSPVAMVCAIVVLIIIIGAFFCGWLAPHDPFDLASLNLLDSMQPPAFLADGTWSFPLGTDDQGRDVLSAVMYGTRISLIVGIFAIVFALIVGVSIGLISGYVGGSVDTVLMRVADVQLTFPAILIALLVDGVIRALLPREMQQEVELYVLIFAIGIARWPQFARTVRGSTMVERHKDYVVAARVIGVSPARIMAHHILPNVVGPVLVIATLNLGLAVIDEATLSFLGVGLPPTEPSLGTLIRIGNDYLFGGQWWITIFPGITLAVMVLSFNLLGDWLRDALNPRLR
ncbi:MAG TPA: ABC transporter permease [Acetobacteraceae bacterium]|jgi:peptide/nickel transport system permease protein|nr:ABC transporter permease [Acetobacteraceae bacterium]